MPQWLRASWVTDLQLHRGRFSLRAFPNPFLGSAAPPYHAPHIRTGVRLRQNRRRPHQCEGFNQVGFARPLRSDEYVQALKWQSLRLRTEGKKVRQSNPPQEALIRVWVLFHGLPFMASRIV